MTGQVGEGEALVVSELVAGYGDIEILHGVSITVGTGQAVAIVGANGAGKTTLLRTISGLLPARRGSIEFGGRSLAGLQPHQIARLGVAHVPEGRQILQHLTVRDNMFLGSPQKAGRHERLEKQLETFPILRDKLDQPGGQLSGGQQQMLAIARALMSDPKLLLLDEPSLGLSPKLTDDLCALLIQVRSESNATFVLVEQNVALAAELTDHAVLIQRGLVIRTEESRLLMSDDELLEAYLA
jgi:branched-chain amino acid transport system ATP-binding protein